MLRLDCFIRFSSALDLPSVAALISKRLFGGLPFVKTDEFDEMEGMRLEQEVLMLHVCVYGASPNFALTISTNFAFYRKPDWSHIEHVNICSYIEESLASLNQIQIVPT